MRQVAFGFWSMAVRTPTLPPATHTNLFVVGTSDAVLIEPASPHDDELDRVAEEVAALEAEGIAIREIWLTHHHADHASGAAKLRRLFDVPIAAHRETAQRLRGLVDRTLDDGDEQQLGDSLALRAIHTPGHAPGHLCFLEPRSGQLIAGDMVAGVGTILIQPSDGDMRQYLASLERLQRLEVSSLLPAHGDALNPSILRYYVQHRLEREAKIAAALRALRKPSPVSAIVAIAYVDAPRRAWPIAALSTEAHLIKLEADGVVARVGRTWQLRTA